jgi:hypothetical protein
MTISEPTLREVEEVLARKFDWPPGEIREARRWLTGMARTVTPAVQLDVIKQRGGIFCRLR